MLRLIVIRLVSAIPVLLLVMLMAFFLMRMVPGDPTIVMGGLQSTPQEREAMRQALGLDQPQHVQFWRWASGLVRGDLGRSVILGTDVTVAAASRLPVTFSIALYAFALTLLVGLVAGVLAALRHNTWIDRVLMTGSVVGVSLPNFWLALMLIVLFSVQLRWLPAGGYIPFTDDPVGWLRSATLPAVALALLQMGLLARITRSTMLEVLNQDYVRTARAKGLGAFKVVVKHAFTNTLIPVLTTVGHIFSLLMGGSIVIETVFSIPGFGLLVGSAILSRDYPVIQGGLLLFAVMLVVLNIVIDLLYAWLDLEFAMVTSPDSHFAAMKPRPWWRSDTVRRLLRDRMFMVGAVIFAVIVISALLAPWLAPADPLKVVMRNRFHPPSAQFWFGTDNLGRDLWSRVLHGGRLSLLVGFVVVSVNAVVAVGIGAVAGYFRRLDNALMRAMDALMAFPAIMLALGIAAVLGPSLVNAMIALAVVFIPRNARLVRATFLVVREMPYVEAAVAAGARPLRIIGTHILPNCMAPLVVALTFVFAYAVLSEAVLSFLGLGTPPPAPSWGGIIAEGRYYMRDAPWIVLIPGGVLAITVLSLNLMGDGLRDVLDPRLKVHHG